MDLDPDAQAVVTYGVCGEPSPSPEDGQPGTRDQRGPAAFPAGLVDVSTAASEAGFEIPVALTLGAWQHAVAWDHVNAGHPPRTQHETERLWHVLVMARRCHSPSRTRSTFPVVRIPNLPGARLPRVTTLHLSTTYPPPNTGAVKPSGLNRPAPPE